MSVGAFDVVSMHVQELADFIGARRLKLAAPPAQHDGAVLGDIELRVDDAATGSRRAQALPEAERAAEPLDRLSHVFVDEEWVQLWLWVKSG